MNLYKCPECHTEVICRRLEDFRCPCCGYAGGNQLSLFRAGRENNGTIKHLGAFDPIKNAVNAHYYHLEKEAR